jgi:hypothetical protein
LSWPRLNPVRRGGSLNGDRRKALNDDLVNLDNQAVSLGVARRKTSLPRPLACGWR